MADDRVALVRQVKDANDIVDVVGTYVALRPAGPTFKGLCPFHEDHRPSFDVDPRRQRYRCWSCQKHGDVISFIQEHDRVDFLEALELLARRAGITLKKTADSEQNRGRARMLEVVLWAAEQFHRCLLDSPLAEAARCYLGERRLTDETIRRFGLGYAPSSGEWLYRRAVQAGLSADVLEAVGLIARRQEANGPEEGFGGGYYDRFRDRVMFPIRNPRGQAVGFGGRILPSSPFSARAPKYYNSSETVLFKKSEQLYGFDQARQAATSAGYVAVVEGYTDVLMAHQVGVAQVVATMGTALNARHVQQLLRWRIPRVVLVFDADEGGETGVDRALEIFVSQDVDLAVATLPGGMDPCDLLVEQGPEPFKAALARAVDALDFKLDRVLSGEKALGVEGRKRAVDAVLGVIAAAPEMQGQAGAVKQELTISRIAQRLGIKEETVWARLRELRAQRRAARRPLAPGTPQGGGGKDGPPSANGGATNGTAPRVGEGPAEEEKRQAPARPHERELLQVLLAEPGLVPLAAAEVAPGDVEHPGLRRLWEGLVSLQAAGQVPDLDGLRARLDNPRLVEFALGEQEVGRRNPDRPAWLRQILAEFRRRRVEPEKQELQNQLHAANDHTEAVELLRRLQKHTRDF